jgi:hypothetical protein
MSVIGIKYYWENNSRFTIIGSVITSDNDEIWSRYVQNNSPLTYKFMIDHDTNYTYDSNWCSLVTTPGRVTVSTFSGMQVIHECLGNSHLEER